MEATALSLARSVLDGVLSSAGSAVADEVARLIGVPKEVDFIRNELEMMRAFLKVSSIHPVPSDTVRTWVKQVRDLAYDVEDCLLDFALYADRASSSRFSSWLPGAVAERHRIAERIRDLKASVVELNQRNQRYHIVVVDGTTPARVGEQQAVVPYQDMLSSELAFQVSDVIGRNHEKTELIELISSSTTTTASSAGLRVVSVWGMGGMGKSSLVRMVHNDAALLDEFDYGAWSPCGTRSTAQTPEEWEHVCKVFDQFGDKEGSLIIVTTRREDVARHCARFIVSSYDGLPYHLKPIFLYLGIFPENHEIRRTRLLRRWMAEGYIAKNRDMPMEDVAELFYSELINRSMIQPSKNLRYLETLDIQDTKVKQLPRGVSNLKKLRYLLAGVNFTKELMQKMGQDSGRNNHIASIFGRGCCKVFNSDWFSVRAPKGIEKLDNLHMLGVIDVGKGHGVAGRNKKLTNLTKLRRLDMTQKVTISKGAMPQLEQLWLDKCPSWQDDKDGLSGVPDLQNLKELLLKHCGDKENLINILQEQVNMHSKQAMKEVVAKLREKGKHVDK
nr:unnamed protein product [Digitaria exilis]